MVKYIKHISDIMNLYCISMNPKMITQIKYDSENKQKQARNQIIYLKYLDM